jgi:hypothetical protein
MEIAETYRQSYPANKKKVKTSTPFVPCILIVYKMQYQFSQKIG